MQSPILPDLDLGDFKKNKTLFLIWAITLIILGTFAISAAVVTTIISVLLLGILILASGIVLLVDAFTFWWRKWKGFFLHLGISVLYLTAGMFLILNPLLGSMTLTLLLGCLYLALGLFRILYSLYMRAPKWGWGLFNGIISMILGLLILLHWPASSLYIIGIFVGIDLLMTGWFYLMTALATPSFELKEHH